MIVKTDVLPPVYFFYLSTHFVESLKSMIYHSLESCLTDLERNGHLIRVREEVDPVLEMAAIHLRVHEAGGPALLFERVKGSSYRAASNIFGTTDRSRFVFRSTFKKVEQLIRLKNDPLQAVKHPFRYLPSLLAGMKALPLKNPVSKPVLAREISVADLPLIQHWPKDGGAFVTLPQVYTEDPDRPGILQANLGMYRIQLTGNDYPLNKEVGLHYQLHRGIGVHQTKANAKNQPLHVSVFVGGPPAHTVAAVMPLPEGLSEMTFAGVLGGRRFRYVYRDGFCVSTDADFVITGQVFPNDNKPEGPFGDHLGYYSLQHPFPVMKVHKVYARKNAIWPFTVVGRPPQEDTAFGNLIHELTGSAVQNEIPGLDAVHAVDAAGVHPLLFAIGQERYTPYLPVQQPAELLTIAHRILGTGQLSLAKYLFIAARDQDLSVYRVEAFLQHILKRINTTRDIHFHTQTTIDTLDYSGEGLNTGSKVVFAACGAPIRELSARLPEAVSNLSFVRNAAIVMPGIVALEVEPFDRYETVNARWNEWNQALISIQSQLEGFPLIVLCDDAAFLAANTANFLWATFTKSNPSHDIYGVNESSVNKHWGCTGPVVIDARKKPHHAPVLEKDPKTEEKIEPIFRKGGSLYNVL